MSENPPAPSPWPRRRRRAAELFRRRGLPLLGLLAVVVTGAALGSALAPEVPARVGPIEARLRVVPSIQPGVQLLVPPAGRVEFGTHLAPVAVQARIESVDLESARNVIASPTALQALQAAAPDELRGAVLLAAATTAGCSLAGAVGLSLLVYRRRWRRTGQVAGAMAGVLVLTAAGLGATFDSDRFAQPRFTGLLSQAPYVAGQASSLVSRLESYRSGLADIVQGVTTLYATSGRLPVLGSQASEDVVTALHVSDIHLNPLAFDLVDRVVEQFAVDVVIDTGDVTTWGTEVESGLLSRIGDVKAPYVFVRGNHDSRRTQQAVAANPNAVVLDGDVAEVAGLVIAGIGDPRFTPETAGSPPSAAAPAAPSRTASPGGTPSGPAPSTSSPVPSTSVPAPGAAPSASDDPLFSPDPQVRAGAALAGVVRDWNASNPAKPVSVALVHEPYAVPPLLGTVPLVLTGHFHSRDVRLDESGTRVMREGSTGGGGISSTSLQRVTDEDPVPQTATLLYIARSGERAGQVLAYDQITVGGFGLASVSLDRTVVRPDEPVLAPGEVAPSEGADDGDGGDGGDGGDTTPGPSAPAAVVTSATRRG